MNRVFIAWKSCPSCQVSLPQSSSVISPELQILLCCAKVAVAENRRAQLLELIPGLKLIPLPESELCCGAAGSYNLTQPEMAERLGMRKASNIVATGATALFTGNVGCLMQIARHLKAVAPDLWCAHPIDALWASYSGEPLGR